MAFFNLTQLGPQNPFHSASTTSECNSQPPTTTSKDLATLPGTVGPSYSQPLPSFTSSMYTSRDTTTGSVQPHKGSHAKFSEMRIKHQRSVKGPMELYQQPITTSQQYGWWIKEGGHAPKWAQGDRHVNVNSEMTRYVDEMMLTNKDFSLF